MTCASVRPAVRADAATILAMIRELARFERAEEQVHATAEDLERDGWGDTPRFEALIAEQDGTAVGFALFFHNYSTWEGRAGLFLEDLYVSPAARGSGAGRALVVRLARIAVERRCARFEFSVLDWNPARRFYEALGFEGLTEWIPYRLDGKALRRLAEQG
ncbi:MAG: GNAT family N-acetyltransferase [Inquilinus sp.]|nr:GNAT family N-acetyltransferase [Inquilinus sp.]